MSILNIIFNTRALALAHTHIEDILSQRDKPKFDF